MTDDSRRLRNVDPVVQQQEQQEQQEIEHVVERLSERFPQTSQVEIAFVVHEEHDKLAAGRIRDYIPVLVEHVSRDRLRQSGQGVRTGE
jgi:hypothetical protein